MKVKSFWSRATCLALALLVALALSGSAAQTGPSVLGPWPEKGPYLIYTGEPSQMTILWELADPVVCSVSWGRGAEYEGWISSLPTSGLPLGYGYEITLTGLLPDSTYSYTVDYVAGSVTSSFRTAPAPSASSVKFVGWADTQVAESFVKANRQFIPTCLNPTASETLSIVQSDLDWQTMIALAGDWVRTTPPEEHWNSFFGTTAVRDLMTMLPIQGCAGNHDVISFTEQEYLDWGSTAYTDLADDPYLKYWPYPYVDDHYWSFDYGPIHFVVLDPFSEEERHAPLDVWTDQLDWLSQDLAQNTKPWTIVLQHVPFQDRSEYGTYSFPWLYADRMRNLIEQSGVDLILAGHTHQHGYELLPTPQLTMGSASDGGGVCVFYTFDVAPTEIVITCYESNGAIFDTIYVPNR